MAAYRKGFPAVSLKSSITITIGIMIMTAVITFSGIGVSYGKWWFPFYAIAGLITAILVANQHIYMRESVKSISDMTFSIYLLHMPIAGIIARLFNLINYSPIILRTVLCVGASVISIQIIDSVAKKVGQEKLIELLIGLRKRRNRINQNEECTRL